MIGPCDRCGQWTYSWCEACEAYEDYVDEEENVVATAICRRCDYVNHLICGLCDSSGYSWDEAKTITSERMPDYKMDPHGRSGRATYFYPQLKLPASYPAPRREGNE